jgi:predicted dehydrogenase
MNSEPRTVRWGLIGAGDIARKRVAAALRDARGSTLTAVSRARADLAEAFAKTAGAERWHARWEDLVRDPGIDAVYVATPVHVHAAQAIAAAEAGKHVLCEKPMAMDVAECDRMIAACRANHVRLGVAYYRHFYPAVVRLRAMLEAGEIGDPVLAQIDAFERFNPQPDEERHWYVKRSLSGGGPMFDFGCHRLEILLSLFGPVRHTVGLTANVIFDREVEDTAIAALTFESGPCATVTVTHAAIEPRDTLRVFGTSGSIHIAVLNAGQLVVSRDGHERHESHPPAANLHQPLVEDFVEAVRTDRAPAVHGEIGRAVAELEAQIYQPQAVPDRAQEIR